MKEKKTTTCQLRILNSLQKQRQKEYAVTDTQGEIIYHKPTYYTKVLKDIIKPERKWDQIDAGIQTVEMAQWLGTCCASIRT